MPFGASGLAGDYYVGYNGAGRLHYPVRSAYYYLFNYQYFRTRANLSEVCGPYVGANVSYTYPDVNNMFPAAEGRRHRRGTKGITP
jgi:hypothetical protein